MQWNCNNNVVNFKRNLAPFQEYGKKQCPPLPEIIDSKGRLRYDKKVFFDPERSFFMRRFVLMLILLLCVSFVSSASGEEAVEFFQAPKQIVVTFTGDCTLGCDPRERGQKTGFETYIEQYGYEYPFAQVKQYFEQDDLTVINLEGTFYDYDANLASDKYYHFRGPTEYAQMLPLASIEACSLGNNHILDYGTPGLESTVAALKDQGVAYFGTTEYNNDVYIFEKNGVKIGFVSVYITHWWTPGIPTLIKQDMQDLRDAGCNMIIACMHGGVEYDVRHDANQEKMADRLIVYGADIVVGNHPHCVQGIREQDGVCTLWSLGNFSFGGNSKINGINLPGKKKGGPPSVGTYIAQFTLSFDDDNTYLGHQLNIIPCYTTGAEYRTDGQMTNNYQPIPVTGKDAEKVIKSIQDDTPYKRLQLNPFVEGVGAVQNFVPAPVR